MYITLNFISGCMVGVEYYADEFTQYFIIDLGIVRIMVEKDRETS